MRISRVLISVSCSLVVLLTVTFRNVNSVTLTAAASSPVDDTNAAMNEPDKFAWSVFTDINKSANNGTNDSIWETWALQENVYADPNNKPVWPGSAHQLKTLRPPIKLEVFRQLRTQRLANRSRLLIEPGKKDNVAAFVAPNPLSEEVRMNFANFDFIVRNELWHLNGQIAAFNSAKAISFPTDAKEVKAHWKVIKDVDKSRYHWQQGADGKTYGLVALHIMTKDLPNWFWATWEHVDNPGRCMVNGCRDTFGIDKSTGNVSQALVDMLLKASMGTEWQNYRLTGTQVEFTDSTGRPTILGNSEIETPFMPTSSCITCHSKASVNGSGDRLDFFTPDGQSDNGVPNPEWFYNTASSPQTMKYIQLDFIWSLMLAQPKG